MLVFSWRVCLFQALFAVVVLLGSPAVTAQNNSDAQEMQPLDPYGADEELGPLHETVWFNGFGFTTPNARLLSGYMALGYEAITSDTQSWGIDLRRDSYGGTLGSNKNNVVFFGVGFSVSYYPMGRAPNGFYVSPHGSIGYGSFITRDEVMQRNVLHDAGGLEVGITAGYSWTVMKWLQLRAGLGANAIYLPDYDETIVAGGLSGDLRVGYVF